MRRRTLLLAWPAALLGDERAELHDWLGQWVALLTEESPNEFLDHMAKPLRGRVAGGVQAMVAAAQVSASVTLLDFSGEGDTRELDIDWVLEMRFRALATPNEQRRARVRLKLERRKKSWQVVSFTPESLLAGPRPAA
ncbi:MAG: hypothetical protein JNK87_39380 [Bryobacterales bacterium]|nr:hypothetical protein [Bryobacterales bacterium]